MTNNGIFRQWWNFNWISPRNISANSLPFLLFFPREGEGERKIGDMVEMGLGRDVDKPPSFVIMLQKVESNTNLKL